MCENSYIVPTKMSIERVIEVPNGGAVNHPWSSGAKYAGNSSKLSSGKTPSLHRRRLLSIPGLGSRSNFNQGNPGYRSTPSVNDNILKPGKGVRIRSINTTDENNERKTTYYNKDGEIVDIPDEFHDQLIQSETKSQTEDVHNQNSGLTKTRNNSTPVQNDKLTSEGDFVNPSQLMPNGRSVIDKTKDRRAAPLLQSKYQDNDKEFLPVYSIKQIENKDKHTLEVLEALKKKYYKL